MSHNSRKNKRIKAFRLKHAKARIGDKAKQLSKEIGYSEKAIRDNKRPKPIGKGISRYERIEKRGLFFKKGFKVKSLRANISKGTNRQLTVAKTLNPSDMPYKHLNLDLATKVAGY